MCVPGSVTGRESRRSLSRRRRRWHITRRSMRESRADPRPERTAMQTATRRNGDVMLKTTLCCVALVASGCARAASTPTTGRETQPAAVVDETMTATAELRDRAGASVGTARLTGDNDGTITLVAHVDRMTPGSHGIHFHAVGSCTPGDSTAFAAAGPHHNPLNRKHGLENPDGPHAGDLPNLV